MKRLRIIAVWTLVLGVGSPLLAQQPAVNNNPNEPNLASILKNRWRLDVRRDLRNPVPREGAPAALFRRVDANKAVVFKPAATFYDRGVLAGGWYPAEEPCGKLPSDVPGTQKQIWDFTVKNLPPVTLASGETKFDPGARAFGLWVGVEEPLPLLIYSQPAQNPVLHEPFKAQPHKALIYPNVDVEHDRAIPHSFLIAWECGSDDDFQDVITQVDNVLLLPADPPLPGILAADAQVRKLAGGFKFVEGPAWNPTEQALYFSNIPDSQIVRFKDDKAEVVNSESGESNGLMFDGQGALVACEGGSRQMTRTPTGGKTVVLASRFEGKRLNSPNDMWLDAAGGVYFTDPRYGPKDNLELDKEAVYYLAADGKLTRLVDNLVRPNGIALSPDGRYLYVVDHGASTLHRYPIGGPGKIGPGERIAFVTEPDGMAVDAQGRLYVTCYGGICVLEGDGRRLGTIPTPEWPTNCTFGGKDWNVLFITARTSLYAIDTLTRGWHVHLDGMPKTQPAGP